MKEVLELVILVLANPQFITLAGLAIVGLLIWLVIKRPKALPVWLLASIVAPAFLLTATGIIIWVIDGDGRDGTWQSKTYYGYYGDLGKDGATTIKDEEIVLQFAQRSNRVRASSSGEVSREGKLIKKTWRFEGFRNGVRLALAFATGSTKDDPNPSGIGIYNSEQRGSTDYTGTTIYLDCELGSAVQCPYAITPDKLDAIGAKRRWPKLFQQKCEKIDLTPDKTTIAVACPSSPAPRIAQ